MFVKIFEDSVFFILACLVIGSLIWMHVLLFIEHQKLKKSQRKRIGELESLVREETAKSRSISLQTQEINQLKEKTDDQLEVIKLQVKAMKGLEKKI